MLDRFLDVGSRRVALSTTRDMFRRRTVARGVVVAGLLTLSGGLLPRTSPAASVRPAFDHDYVAYRQLLTGAVQWQTDGVSSVVDYRLLNARRRDLTAVLTSLSRVTQTDFEAWPAERQMAFLINAYNGFTLELVLRHYPRVRSIKDIGGVLQSPWRIPFFELLGRRRTLDWVEHEMLRPRFRDPRVHFAVNCASRGCPALRPEPFTATALGAQLDDGMRRFLQDRRRNRVDGRNQTLVVSPIFKWYREDFELPNRSLQTWLAERADWLTDDRQSRVALRNGRMALRFDDYDWSLNDVHATQGSP